MVRGAQWKAQGVVKGVCTAQVQDMVAANGGSLYAGEWGVHVHVMRGRSCAPQTTSTIGPEDQTEAHNVGCCVQPKVGRKATEVGARKSIAGKHGCRHNGGELSEVVPSVLQQQQQPHQRRGWAHGAPAKLWWRQLQFVLWL